MFWASAVFDVFVEIVLAVVVGELFAEFDDAAGVDEDFVAFDFDFAVWPAGVIDVPGSVLSCGAVDGFAVAELEEIFPTNTIRFVFCDDIAPVLNDESALGNSFVRKHAKSRRSAFYGKMKCSFSWGVRHSS